MGPVSRLNDRARQHRTSTLRKSLLRECTYGFGVIAGNAFDALADQLTERFENWVGDGVSDEIAVSFALKEAGVMKEAELFGNASLFHIKFPDQITHGERSGHQMFDDAHTGGFGEDGEEARGFDNLGV